MTTTQITNRITELNTVIANALKSTTIESAAIWTAAVKERNELKNRL